MPDSWSRLEANETTTLSPNETLAFPPPSSYGSVDPSASTANPSRDSGGGRGTVVGHR